MMRDNRQRRRSKHRARTVVVLLCVLVCTLVSLSLLATWATTSSTASTVVLNPGNQEANGRDLSSLPIQRPGSTQKQRRQQQQQQQQQQQPRQQASTRKQQLSTTHSRASTTRSIPTDSIGTQQQRMFPRWNGIGDKPVTSQRPDGGAFIHIGKTGGSSLSVLLRNGCHSFRPHPCHAILPRQESFASKLIQSYYHVPDFSFLRLSHHTFHVVTVRDPFDRTVSAFVFEHLQNRLARNETVDEIKYPKYEEAYQCFPTLQAFVENLGDNPNVFRYPYKQNMVIADSCPDLAKAAFHSKVYLYNHLYFSFRKIHSLLPKQSSSVDTQSRIFYAVRQEHLWEDWKSVNVDLGQQEEDVYIPSETRIRNMTAVKQPVTRDLDAKGRMLLCNALKVEYQAYFWFLKRARNLQKSNIQQSIDLAKKNCPVLDIDELVQTV